MEDVMRSLVVMLVLMSSAYAADDFKCEKKASHHFAVECNSKKEADVALQSINGGECPSPSFHQHVAANKSFEIPGTSSCFYVRSVTLSIDGKSKTFAPF